MNTTGSSSRGWCHQICKPQRPRQPRTCWMLPVAFLVWSWLWQLLRSRQRFIILTVFSFAVMPLVLKVAQNQSNLELLSFLVSSVPASHTKWTEVPLLVTLFQSTVLHYYSVQPASLPQCSSSGPHFATRLKFRGRAIKMLTSVLPFYKCVDCIKQHFIFIEKLIF